jgi:predicted enzyme related to lactoylglutathione lyase
MSNNPVVHFEMPYENAERLQAFYRSVFGWQMNALGAEMGNYVLAGTTETDAKNMVTAPGTINGGFAPKSDMYNKPNVVIAVKDIAAAMQSVTGAGGTVHGEPIEIPGVGMYVHFTDTEGNRVSLLQPAARQG